MLTVAGVCDRTRCREVKLDKRVWTQADVSGNSIACVGLLNERESRSIRTTNWHSGATRVEEPRTSIN